MKRKSVPDHKLDSHLPAAFSTDVAAPLGAVREIVALPDPRKAELANIESYEARNDSRTVLPGFTAEVRTAARRKLNAGQYRNCVRDVLLGFVEDPNLPVNKRIRAAACLAKFLPKESKIEIKHDEAAIDTTEVDARAAARRRMAEALLALESPK